MWALARSADEVGVTAGAPAPYAAVYCASRLRCSADCCSWSETVEAPEADSNPAVVRPKLFKFPPKLLRLFKLDKLPPRLPPKLDRLDKLPFRLPKLLRLE